MPIEEIKQGSTIELTDIDSDWEMEESEKIASITFYAHAQNDVISIKDGSDVGPHVMQHLINVAKASHTIYLDGSTKRLYIDHSECTVNAASKVIINLWPHKRS